MAALTLVGIVIWWALLLFFRLHKNWLPYYLIGSVGLAFAVVGLAHNVLHLDDVLRRGLTVLVHNLGLHLDLTTKLVSEAPGTLLVLVVPQIDGWTVFQVGVESSGILEMAVLIGIVGFYPGWSVSRRFYAASLGIAATFFANVVRITFIAWMIQNVGKDALFISHTVIGRLIFALLVLVIFWFVLSMGTLSAMFKRMNVRKDK